SPGVGTFVSLSSAPTTSVVGQTVKFTALAVDSGTPSSALTGTMSFFDESTLLGTKNVMRGKAVFSTNKLLTAGDHPITATYDRGVGYEPVTSPELVQT